MIRRQLPTSLVQYGIAVFTPPHGVTYREFEDVCNAMDYKLISESYYIVIPPGWSVEFMHLDGRYISPSDFWGLG